MRYLLAILLFILGVVPTAAQRAPAAVNGCQYFSAFSPTLSDKGTTVFRCDANGQLLITGTVTVDTSSPVTIVGTSSTGAYSPVTVGVASALALAAGTGRVFLDLHNPNMGAAAATIWCGTANPAVANAAGTWPLPPGASKWWEGTYVPNDAIYCIASAAAAPLTVGVK